MIEEIKQSNQALALVKVEGNNEAWLHGKYFEIRSSRKLLQNWIGRGGILWVVVSRPAPNRGRFYSLTLRFSKCKAYTYGKDVTWGKYAVRGDIDGSEFYNENDARTLLLGLRFENGKPLSSIDRIGSDLQTPRLLTELDTKLMELYRPPTNAWSVFISYSRSDAEIANDLKKELNKRLVSVFVDSFAIRKGDEWRKSIISGVKSSRTLLLLIGKYTYKSIYVQEELSHAERMGLRIIPIIHTGELSSFKSVEKYQGIYFKDAVSAADEISQSISVSLIASDTQPLTKR